MTALVRDNEKAARVGARGAHPVVGNLADPESYRATADAQDGYIHTALDDRRERRRPRPADHRHVAGGRAPPANDRTRCRSRPGSSSTRPALWVVGRASEAGRRKRAAQSGGGRRVAASHTSTLVLDANTDHLRTAVVRPGVVYGGGAGIIGDLFKMATNGLVRVVGDGNNHWPLVYDRDLADLYARIAASDDASGVFNANDEGDERVNDIVAAIGPYLPHRPDVRYVPIEEARSKMGPYADALALDQKVRSTRSRALGWNPSLHSVAGNAARLLEEWRARAP